jgi:RNA polymerase sigma factor (sigma-70 family)
MHFDASHQDPYPLPPEGFAAWELRAANATVRAFLAVHGSILGLEVADLIQETLAAWWEARRTYDARRGANPKTYFNHIARGVLVGLQRAALAQKRGRGIRPQSLDAPIDADDPESENLYDQLPGTIEDADPREAVERHQLQEAIAQARSRLALTPEDRRIWDLRLAGHSPTEIERIMGMRRTTVNSRLERIFQRLRSPELADFLRPFID